MYKTCLACELYKTLEFWQAMVCQLNLIIMLSALGIRGVYEYPRLCSKLNKLNNYDLGHAIYLNVFCAMKMSWIDCLIRSK